jgi:magnesium chelatase family protein
VSACEKRTTTGGRGRAAGGQERWDADPRVFVPGTFAATASDTVASSDLSSAAVIQGAPLGIASVEASVVVGLEPRPIQVEVCSTRGPAFFQMVGLAEAAVREARVRVASALAGLGVLLDEYAVTINLAPADLRKAGATLDLALALGILGALGELPSAALERVLVLGELGLDGALRPVRGLLPQLEGAKRRGLAAAIVPRANAIEAGIVRDIDVRLAQSLTEVMASLRGGATLVRAVTTPFSPRLAGPTGDLAEVRGQAGARRALEIAAAGAHNLLFIGPPGSGKTLLARLLPSILPPLDFDEAVEATAIHSVAGLLPPDEGIVSVRPFRAPHHSVSEAGLVGGGDVPRPGEVSLAHHGVLFLDELAEFRRGTLEALRQPLEDGTVCIARSRARAWFPARPLVVGAVNPCPCGYSGHPRRRCACSEEARKRYRARLSGPLLDRLDIHVSVPPVEVSALTRAGGGESSADVRARVERARGVQRKRAAKLGLSSAVNAALGGAELERLAALDKDGRRLIEAAVEKLGLSARAFTKVLRVARTIADLEGEERVRATHVAEAIQARLLDREVLR